MVVALAATAQIINRCLQNNCYSIFTKLIWMIKRARDPGQAFRHGIRRVQDTFTCKKLKPHLDAPQNWHGTPRCWHRTDNFSVRHYQLSPCKRIGPEKIWALVPKILGVPRLPPGGSLGTGKSRHGAENVDLHAVQDQFCCGYNQGACVAYTLHS